MLDHLCRESGAADCVRFRPDTHQTSSEIGGVEGIARRHGLDGARNPGQYDSAFVGFGAVCVIADQ